MALLVSGLNAISDQRIFIEDYLVWSTVLSTLLFIPVLPSIFLGYLLIIPNSLVLLMLDRLSIHRNHLIAILLLTGFSLIGAHLAGGDTKPVIAQILGITVTSVYFFNALTTFGIPLPRWMDMYIRVAIAAAVLGILQWAIARILHTGDGRLKSIFLEPSHYIFLTLPAIGYCSARYIEKREYGPETLIFLLTYVLADSSLGFLGILLVGAFNVTTRLKSWQILLATALGCAMLGGLYLGSENFRLRATDTITAIAKQDLGGTNASTFALLSNVYVTSQSFQTHPFTGVGIGGYANAYDKYIGTLSGPGLTFLNETLNRDDANSLFLRIAAELGIPGLLVIFGFLVICGHVRGSPYQTIRNALLPYLLVRMLRFGAYFSVEFYFFVGIYLLNYMQCRATKRHVPKAYMSAT